MFTRKRFLLLSLLGLSALLVFTGCSPSQPTAQAPAAAPQSPAILYTQQMSDLVSDIEMAVLDSDYETAEATFADVQGLWKKAPGDVQAKDKAAHEAIAVHIDNLSNEFKGDPPESKNILSTLDLLKTDLNALPQ